MIRVDGSWFKDEHGRFLFLRGVNLGGSSKVPYPHGSTHVRDGFFEHRNVSFVGRPFPLAEADEHFARLKRWGLTFLRFLVTWEAIEHAGPGQYDHDYLDHLAAVVAKAGEHGLHLFIDPHQDVWSRFSGGDGAPGWTLEAVGLEMRRFAETGAAIVHNTHGDPFPRMVWPTNNDKLAAATMFSLFFGGDRFAPQVTIDGEPAQAYLQRHYINAIVQVAQRLKGMSHVVGYDSMNEPSPGYIGYSHLGEAHFRLKLGQMPTPYQSMLLGDGYAEAVEMWELGPLGLRKAGTQVVNSGGARAWQEGIDCIWRRHGVWDVADNGAPTLLKPHYFAKVDFAADCLRPFANRYAQAIRQVDPHAILFFESEAMHTPPIWGPQDATNVVNAAHWYDATTLISKQFFSLFTLDDETERFVLGRKRVQRLFNQKLGRIKGESLTQMGGAPTLIGEIGIPYDMNNARAYRSGIFKAQTQALDRSLRAVEANLLNYTLWNYTADNDNARGDQWNGEDLSIFSRDQQTDPDDPDSGGRALAAVIRPFPIAVAGEPLQAGFDLSTRTFTLRFRHETAVSAPTELYVPHHHYPHGVRVTVSDGAYTHHPAEQRLTYQHSADTAEHTITITPEA